MKARCAAFDGTLSVTARRGGQPLVQNPTQNPAQRSDSEGPRGTLVRARFAWDAMLADAQPGGGLRALQS
jgi:hypothetical protein